MATTASYFSGTALVPSQRAVAGASAPDYSAGIAAPSPSKSRDPRYTGCIPATVLHIARSIAAAATAAAADGGGDPVLSIDGVETSNVRVLGRVVSMVSRETDVSFTLDDGTGKIALVRWITDQPDALDTSYIQDGAYVKVHANLMGFQAKQQGFARSIRPVTNFNEVVLHFIECIHVHLKNVQTKMQGQLPPAVQTNTYTQVPYSGGAREHQVHFTSRVNQGQLSSAVQTNTPTYVPFSGGVREHQVHFTPQVNHGLPSSAVQPNKTTYVPYSGGVQEHQNHFTQVNQGQFPPTVQTNASTHVPFYSGVREHQVQFAPQVNQFSAYPGTGTELQKRVLDVMQEPDIIAREYGVHIDEVATRTGMPRTNIVEIINQLADAGFLCWTIDDNHVKYVCNG